MDPQVSDVGAEKAWELVPLDDALGELAKMDLPVKDLPGLMEGKAEPDTYKEAFLPYAAYFGTYTVDLVKAVVVHHVEGAITAYPVVTFQMPGAARVEQP